jgi:ABC-type bacteriocin/lantibiotic exporter with double-glycine peptidase domain
MSHIWHKVVVGVAMNYLAWPLLGIVSWQHATIALGAGVIVILATLAFQRFWKRGL